MGSTKDIEARRNEIGIELDQLEGVLQKLSKSTAKACTMKIIVRWRVIALALPPMILAQAVQDQINRKKEELRGCNIQLLNINSITKKSKK